jgi:hypothetical protein
MEKVNFEYDITIRVKFTQEEFDSLLKAFDDPMNRQSKENYVKPGRGAFMNANKNYFSDDQIIEFTNHQIDICCKVLELASLGSKEYHELFGKMFNLHSMIEKEYNRISK